MVSRTLPLIVGTSSVGAEHRLLDGHRQLDDDVVALAAEQRMRRDGDLHQRVAGRAAAEARHALALQPQHMAVAHAGGDAHIQRAALRQGDAAGGAVGRIEEADGQRVLRVLARAR